MSQYASRTTAYDPLRSIGVGDEAVFRRTITAEDVDRFVTLSGDVNPLHRDPDFAGRTAFERPIVHGMLVASYVSTMIGTQLPGTGSVWVRQEFRWAAPVFAGDQLDYRLRVLHKSEGSRVVKVQVSVTNQKGESVLYGDGLVMVLEMTSRAGEPPPNAAAR